MRVMILSFVCVGIGCSTPPAERATCPAIEVSVAADAEHDGNRVVALPNGSDMPLTAEPLVTSADITGARASLTEGQYVLNVDVTPERGQQVRQFSEHNVGRMLVFPVDGRVVRTPTIRDPITGDGFLIGPLGRAEAEQLADAINTNCGH